MTRASYRQHRYQAPAGATELLVVRHGASEPAVPGRPFPLVGGHGDPALAPEGREQAERVGARLADQGIDAIYVTTLRRTAETAAPLAERTGLVPRVEADLREVHLGDWEGGQFRVKVAEGDPIVARMFAEERWDAIPGAEPQDAYAARVAAGLGRIVAAHPGERVAVFTHGGVIGEVLRQATGSRPFAFVGGDNAGITHLVATDGRWVVRRFNDTSHLPGGLDVDPVPDLPEGGSGFSA
ncbi:histidine phosphatase family protein [Aquihabitans sp. G128]|uniref:histidine phosphatase family protein n=1 Tax=Aquihabitans sp. G128 TaxID=2849779 RepID=UPI001C228720|nr:histidine phosphatase family protein [Aquihabitans sp. G128]QXC60218.1 histidine phosphatase family protein [Aquihabitans sp. G128]